jgi:hypothetical protein
LNIQEIIIRLKSDVFYHTVDLIDEDVSNILTQLVWRQGSTTILNTPRSFSYMVEMPKQDKPSSEDVSVELYYVVKLNGNHYYQEVGGTNLHGGGQIYESVSNEGTMSGGIEDPVWVTAKAEPMFPWFYVGIALVGVGIAGTTSFLLIRHRRLRTKLNSETTS